MTIAPSFPILAVEIGRGSSRSVIRFTGELDVAGVQTAKEVSASLTGAEGVVRADFRRLSFLDCSGLAMLVELRNRLRDGGGDLVICNATDNVLKVLALTEIETGLVVEQAPAVEPTPPRPAAHINLIIA